MSKAASVLVVGAGQMGAGMAHRLLARGFAAKVVDPDPTAALGLDAVRLPCDAVLSIAPTFSHVICAVVDDLQARAALLGERHPHEAQHAHNGLARHLNAGCCVLLTSTVSPESARQLAQDLNDLGLLPIDAPISGGPVRARLGDMSMMLAASAEALASAEPVLEAMSGKRHVVSPRWGDASAVKLLNNAVAAQHWYTHANALIAAQSLGIAPEKLHAVLADSSGQSWIGVDRGARALSGVSGVNTAQAALKLLAKDTRLAQTALAQAHLGTDWFDASLKAFDAACQNGHADEDDSTLLHRLGFDPHAR